MRSDNRDRPRAVMKAKLEGRSDDWGELMASPEEWLADTERARRSGRRQLKGVLRPGIVVGLGAGQVTFWMVAAAAILLIVFGGFSFLIGTWRLLLWWASDGWGGRSLRC